MSSSDSGGNNNSGGGGNATDPSGLLNNSSGGQQQPTIVKVINTAREDMNNKFGYVIQYNVDRGRYLVHLTKNQSTVSLKPENLQKANYLEQFQGQYEQLTNDPRVRNELNRITNMIQQRFLGPNIPLKYAAMGLVVGLISCVYFLGASKTFLLFSFTFMLLLTIGPDLIDSSNANETASETVKKIVRNLPQRFTTLVETQLPMGPYLAKNKLIVYGLGGIIVYVFVMGMLAPVKQSGAVPQPSQTQPPNLPTIPTAPSVGGGSAGTSEHLYNVYYKLGFEDAKADAEFGTSLKEQLERDSAVQQSGTTTGGGEEVPHLNIEKMDEFDIFDEPQRRTQTSGASGGFTPTPPPPKKSKMGIGTIMSGFYVYRTLSGLGTDANQQFSFDLLKANLATMETWKLAMLGFSVFNLVRTFLL